MGKQETKNTGSTDLNNEPKSLNDFILESLKAKENTPVKWEDGIATELDLAKTSKLLGADFRPELGLNKINELSNQRIIERSNAEAAKKAEDQGIIGESWGALNQAVLGEILGGGIEGIGYLMDFDQLENMENGTQSFGMALSELGKSLKEGVKEYAPIHVNPEIGDKFMPWRREWWMSNIPSIASAASILIPVAGEAKALSLIGEGATALKGMSALGKLGKTAKGVNKILDKTIDAYRAIAPEATAYQKMALKGLNRAVTGTHIEAHMEASQTFDEQYKKYLNHGMEDEEARHLAAESASFVYKANYANLATEFFQQMLLLRGPKLTKTLNTVAEREAAGIVASKFASVSGLAGQVLSEGLEEAGQFVIQEEGKYFTDVKAGLVKEEGFGDRLAKYATKGELWTSAFFGGLGGGVFHKVGPIIENKMGKMMHSDYVSEKQRTIDDLKSQTSRALEASAKIAQANKSGNKAERKAAEQEMYFSLGFSSAQNGTLDYMLDRYDNIKEMTKEERESYGFSDNYINEIDTHKEKIKKVAELWQENTRRYGHEVSEAITKREFLLHELNEDFPTVKKNYDNLVTKLPRYTETTIEGRKLIDRNIEIKALEKTVKINQNIIDNAEIPNEAKERIKAETVALMDELVVKRGKLEEDSIIYKDQLNDADTLSIASLDGKYGEDLTTAQTVIKLHEKAIKRNTEELINMTSAKGREQIRNVQNQIMEANRLKQKDRELQKDIESDEVLEQGEEAESILSMEQIHDRVLAGDQEIISMIEENPELKTQYENFKNGTPNEPSNISTEENLGGATDFTNISVKESTQQTVATTVSNTIDEHNPPVEDNTEFFKTTKEEEDKTKLSKTNALAWFSAYNENASDKDITEKSKAISNYLENPNTDLTNVEIRFDIDIEYLQVPLKIHQEMRDALNSKMLPKDIGKVPIKAMLYKDGKPIQYAGFNMEINLHDDNYDNFKEDIKEVAAQNIRDQKKLIIEGIFNGKQYRSKILTKSNGHILTSKDKFSTFSEIPLTEIFTDIEAIEFSYGSNNTFLNPKNKSKDNNIEGYVAQNGAIYAKIKTANGNNFPLRLRHTKLNNNEAELIFMLYQDILNNYDVILQNISPEIIDYINNSPDSRINGLSSFLNFNKLTYSKLLDVLVFNGREKTLGKKESVLSVAPKTKNSKTGKEIPATLFLGKYKIHSNDINDPEVKAKIISHLTEFRQRQISVEYLNNPEYKKYIVNNSLVVSNAKTSEPGNGRIFVQPTITYDDNLVLVDNKVVTKKEENVTKEKLRILEIKKELLKINNVKLPPAKRDFGIEKATAWKGKEDLKELLNKDLEAVFQVKSGARNIEDFIEVYKGLVVKWSDAKRDEFLETLKEVFIEHYNIELAALETPKKDTLTYEEKKKLIYDEYEHVVNYTKYLSSNQKNKLLSEASKKKDLALKELESQKTVEVKPTPVEPTLMNAFSEKPSEELKKELTEKDPEIQGATEITFEITPITSVPETNVSEKTVTPEEVNNSIIETEEDKIKKQERLDRAKARKQSGKRDSAFKTIPNDNTNLTEELSIKGSEITHIRSLLPNAIGINIAEDYIEVLKNGELAIGLFKENMIYLSKYATSGTGYHEAFHAVFRTMLSERERNYLYKEAENHFYNYSEQEINTLIDNHSISREEAIKLWYEEKLADEFKDFMLNSGESTYSYPKGIKGLFQRLMNWLNHVFNSKTTIKKLFNDIASSNYKNKKVNISRSVAYKSISAPTTNNKYEPQDVEDIVQQLAYIALNAEKSFTLDTKGLSKEDIKKKIKEFKVQRIIEELEDKELDAIENNDTELEARVGKVLQDLTWFIGKTNDYVSSMGFKETDDTELDDSGNLIYKPSYEVSGKDAASKEIKAIVALTPKYSYYNVNDTSSKVYDTDSYLKFPKFENFGVVWNKLESKLIDKPSIYKDGKKVDSFDRMMDTLLKESKYHPELGVIRNTILASDIHTKNKFHFVFSRTKGNYLDALVSGTEGNMTYKITSSDSFSKNKEIANTWATEFRKNFGVWVNNEFIYDQNKLEIFKDLHFKIFNSITQDHKSKSIQKREVQIGNKIYNVNTVELLTLELKTLGINISPNALKRYIDNLDIEYPNKATEVEKSIIQLENIYLNLDKALISTKTYKGLISTIKGDVINDRKSGPITNDNNQILDQKFFTEELAGAEADFVKVSGENTVAGPGGMKWIPQDNNLMSKKVNAIKQGDLTYLDMLNQSVMHKNSLWIKALSESEETRKKLSISLYGNYKEENVGDRGDKAKDLKESDKLNDMANKYLKGIYIGLAEADKSQQYYIEGFDLEPSQVTFNEKNELSLLSNNAPTILLNYFTDEVNRMRAEHNKIINKELKEEEQVLYYHYNLNKKGDRTPGNYLKSYLFPNMNLEELGVITKDSQGNILKFDTKNNEKELREYITDKFLNAVKKDIDLFIQYGILKQKNGVLTNRSIDNEILRNNYNNNVATAIGDITLNSIIANVEFTKLFTQDPALYKFKGDGFEDFRKRIPLIISSGKDQRIFEEDKWKVRESYNSAVIDNIKSPSDYFDFDKNPENLKVIANATGLSETEIREMFKAYLDVNETDAQAWITIDLYRERMLAWGKWSDNLEASYERIKEGKETNVDNALFAQPLKTVHCEVMMHKGTIITQYNKQSEAVLLPSVVKTSQLGNLLRAMTNRKDENGNALPDIDHVITLDGKKVGAIGVSNIRDTEGKILNDKDIKLNGLLLSNEFCFLQQDLPTKHIHDTQVGTQAVKNVLAMLKMTETYDGLTGLEAYNEYHNTISKLSNLGLVEIKEELGYNDKLGKITDRQKLNRKLRRENINKVSQNIIENLDNNISLDSLPQSRIKFQNGIASTINKSTVKLKQLGGSMIQTSSFGFNDLEVKLSDKVKDGIVWFKDPKTELLPSRLIEENSLNTEEIAIFTRLKEDLLKSELTREQKILLRKQDLKDIEPNKKSLGLLLNVYCK